MKRRWMSDDAYFLATMALLAMLAAAIIANMKKIEADMAACARLPGHAMVVEGALYRCRLVGFAG